MRSVDRGTKRQLRIPGARAWNIGFRTAHLGVTGVLVGGHVFEVAAERLLPWLALSIASGAALVFLEAYPRFEWWREGRGAAVWLKLLLLCLIPWLWPHRVPILAAVLVLAGVGSHMPARFRYFSLLHGRVLEESHPPKPSVASSDQ